MSTQFMTGMITRKSIHTRIMEAAELKGVLVQHQYEPNAPDPRNGYVVDGVWMTPGAACAALGVAW